MAIIKIGFWLLFQLIFSKVSVAAPSSPSESALNPDDIFAATALSNVYKVLNGTISDGSTHTACTKDTLAVRKE